MEAFCHAAPFGHLLTTLQAGNGSAQGDLLQDADVQREPLKEPAKRWRNWYRVVKLYRSDGVLRTPGDVYPGARIFPSADIAETTARTAPNNAAFACRVAEYLGAYPEGERP